MKSLSGEFTSLNVHSRAFAREAVELDPDRIKPTTAINNARDKLERSGNKAQDRR